MGHLAALDMVEHADIDTALHWHLTANHYSPVPTSMIPVCREAIDLAAVGDWDVEVDLPPGTLYQGSTFAPVWAIVEAHHLDAFLPDED